MIESNYFRDNEDLALQFKTLIDWNEIVPAFENGFSDAKTYEKTKDERFANAPTDVSGALDYYESILDAAGDLMGTYVAPRSAEMDRVGLKFENGKVTFPKAQEECYNTLREAGLQPMGIGRKYGGLGLPATVQTLMYEISSRADAAFCLAFGNINIVDIVERYASEALCDEWLPRIAAGEFSAAMALTEPNYGSDLPNVQTKAVKGEDGVWRLTGTKRFITHACGYVNAPSIILTLARTGSPTSGARGLSFFIVQGKDVQVAGIEKKMGLHCSPTCEVVFDNAPGQIIGEEGFGLVKYSMGMMNSARIMIAAQSVGIAEAGYREAKKYASERVQFGKPIEKIPAVRKMLDRMEREIAGMRMLVLEATRAVDLYQWRKEHLIKHEGKSEKEVKADPQIRRWEKLADLFTPMAKYYASEGCVKITSDALQTFGGAGYTEEYDVARIYRDSRITTIYEGTTQLQIVAAIGGIVSGMAPAGNLREYIQEEMKKMQPSAALKSSFEIFSDIVDMYKSMDQGDEKSMVAFETVEAATRFLIGLLMERSLARAPGNEHRKKLCKDIHVDSLAILEGTRARFRQMKAA
jgi:alkylation response protein AidB-like acyl-CoA dehydrogenase